MEEYPWDVGLHGSADDCTFHFDNAISEAIFGLKGHDLNLIDHQPPTPTVRSSVVLFILFCICIRFDGT